MLFLKEANVTAQNKIFSMFFKILMCLTPFFSSNLFANTEANKPDAEKEVVISASDLKASTVAIQDFEKTFAISYSKKSDVDMFLSDIHNYEIKIIENKYIYKVIFLPNKFNGQYLKGGGAIYEVNKISFLITKKQLFE